MQCPQCHAGNREGRRFCANCGAPLAILCPDCGFSNESGEKFCGGCGKTLSISSASETAQKREAHEPERRQLTVMFCDLIGSSALAELLDPEELHRLLAQYQDTCAEVIQHYEGYIARYVGDGLLVYFGYPQAHEDDAQRGVRAGLGVVEAIEQLDSKLRNPSVNLAVRIGVATGLVVAGDIGDGERVEEKAIVGETPNIAARLQTSAKPNTVLIGASTKRLVEGLFDFDDLGPQKLKGISEPVVAYRVLGESGAISPFEAAAVRGLTPLVGRELEIGLLLNRWGQAKEGEGQAVVLSGEAGIGKSRIVRGFRDRLEAEPYSRLLYYGSPYHQNSAFYPVIDQIERGLRFEKDDNATQRLEKLEGVLGDLDLSEEVLAPSLASLLSLRAEGRYSTPLLSPEQLKRKTLETLIAVYEAMTSRQPVLLVVEDAHWIDPSTRELISLLIERLPSYRLLLVITCRPEFESPWVEHTHITTLTLNRLSRKESVAMISKVTGGKPIPDEMRDQIVAKTDGVPLFVEEFTKTVLESDLLKDAGDHYTLSGSPSSLAIPTSLQDSLMARLDRLESVKEIAQLGAVIGRTFSFQLLAGVSRLPDDQLQEALGQLTQSGLIFCRGIPPYATYNFKHALVQDAAYQSLLKSRRQQHHLKVAQVLEERFPGTAETQPELIAHHYTEAGVAEQAVSHWHRAGQRASERSASPEAVSHLTKGLELIKDLPDSTQRTRQELGLYLTFGPVLMSAKGYAAPEVGKAYTRARELCQFVGEPAELFTITWGLWLHNQQRGQLERAQGLADDVMTLARKLSEPAFTLQAHHANWTTLFRLADLTACVNHTAQGIALYDVDQHGPLAFRYGGHDAGVCAQYHAGMSLWLLGYPDQAVEKAYEGLALAKELEHPFSQSLAYYFAARIHQFRKETRLAQETAEATIALADEHGFAQDATQATVMRGWAVVADGQAEAGLREIRSGLSAWRATGALSHVPLFSSILADAYAQVGRTAEALDALAEGLSAIQETGERTYVSEMYRLKGQLLLSDSANNKDEAESCFKQAIEIARQQSARSLELRAATSLSRLWHAQGARDAARELLAPIYNWFSEGFDTGDLKEARVLLDELHASQP